MDIEKLKEDVFNGVLDHGHVVQYVEGDPGYSYTIGRTMQGRPELLVSGLSPEEGLKFLNELCSLDDLRPLQLTETDFRLGWRLMRAEPGVLFGAVVGFNKIEAWQVVFDAAYERLYPYVEPVDPYEDEEG